MSIVGLASTTGRVTIGYVCDWAKPRGYLLHAYVAVVLVNALSVGLLPLAGGMGGMAALSVFFGYTAGACVTLMPVLIEYFVEPKDVAKVCSLYIIGLNIV